MEIAYSVVWGQCSTRLQKKLEGHEKWDKVSSNQNVLDLLKLIKIRRYKFEEEN